MGDLMFSFFIRAALTLGAFGQTGSIGMPWGATRDQIEMSVSNPDSETSNGVSDREGLILGGHKKVLLPDGSPLNFSFYFTPLSQQLARVNLSPSLPSTCYPLLSEFQLEFGQGLELTEWPDVPVWEFIDTRSNTRWTFQIFHQPGTRVPILCGIAGHPLNGAHTSH